MSTSGERINFFGIADDKLIYDERKKRFVHTTDLPEMMSREYLYGGFKSQRPDLIGSEKLDFQWKLRFG